MPRARERRSGRQTAGVGSTNHQSSRSRTRGTHPFTVFPDFPRGDSSRRRSAALIRTLELCRTSSAVVRTDIFRHSDGVFIRFSRRIFSAVPRFFLVSVRWVTVFSKRSYFVARRAPSSPRPSSPQRAAFHCAHPVVPAKAGTHLGPAKTSEVQSCKRRKVRSHARMGPRLRGDDGC